MKKTLVTAFLMTFFFLPKAVLADGMVMWNDPYSDRWDYSGEENQQAFINYEDGTQKMIISIGLEKENNSGAVWLFPIPADPNKINIDVFEKLPMLSGEEISGKAKNQLDTVQDGLQANQIYTIPFIVASKMVLSGSSSGFGAGSLGAVGIENGTESDIAVYEHLEKEDISSEIITAKTADGLYNYLKSKGLKVENGSIKVLNNYIGKNYSFVVSWITPLKEYISDQYIKSILRDYYDDRSLPFSLDSSKKNPNYRFKDLVDNLKQKYPEFSHYGLGQDIIDHIESQQGKYFLQELTQTILNDPSIIDSILTKQKGVFVTFPTKDIYFPLIPTSAYGDKIVPATIRVFGHVSPKIFENIKKYTKTSYYSWNYPHLEEGLEKFAGKLYIKSKYSGNTLDLVRDLKYTKIEINAPSKFFTDDLWINNQAPIETYYPNFISSHPAIVSFILLVLSSVIAGILAGLAVFKELRNNPKKLGLIGLFNCLTLFGLFIATFFVGTKNKNEEAVQLLAEIKQRGYFWKKRIASFFFIIFTPFLLINLLFIFMLIQDLISHGIQPSFAEFIFFAPFIFGAVIPLILFLVFRRIKIEDKDLFQQLKFIGYSSWSFQPKDKMKFAFVPLFSISFLLISWLLIKLIEVTV